MVMCVALQNIVCASSRKLVAVEALARKWNGCKKGYTSPGVFSSDYYYWDWWVTDLSVMDSLIKLAPRLPEVKIHINIAPETMMSDPVWRIWLKGLEALVARHNQGLVVEFSENLGDFVDIDALIRDVRAHRAQVALDDMGSVNSDYQRVLSHDWDIVKIDWRPSVRNKIGAMLGSVISDCDSRGIKTVIEGVETPLCLKKTETVGCTYVQGYAIGRPYILPPINTVCLSSQIAV